MDTLFHLSKPGSLKILIRFCLFFIILVHSQISSQPVAAAGSATASDWTGSSSSELDSLKPKYNKFERPNKSEPVLITVFIHFESLREITSEVTLDFYLVQFWNDSRLLQNSRFGKGELKVTGRELPDELWYPDTYFLLVRDLLYSSEEQYIIVRHSETLEFNRKVRLKTPCTPNVMLFPFDVVECQMRLSSFGYDDTEVVFEWADFPGGSLYIDLDNNNVDHLGFFLKGTRSIEFFMTYGDRNFSTLQTIVYLERKFSAYLIQVYFPAALIVILSWTIFWINLEATPARASLGVTTVLTMLTLATQSTSQNAKHVNSKVTAIDVYLWACFVFVIFAMIEFALSDFTTHSTINSNKNEATAANSKDQSPLVINQLSSCASDVKPSLENLKKEHQNGRFSSVSKKGSKNSNLTFNYANDVIANYEPLETHHFRGKLYSPGGPPSTPYHRNNFHTSKQSSPDVLITPNHTYQHLHELSRDSYGLKPHFGISQAATKSPQAPSGVKNSGGGVGERLSVCSSKLDLKETEAERKREKSLHLVNNLARVLFPLSFLIFNICYWLTLLIKVRKNEHYADGDGFIALT